MTADLRGRTALVTGGSSGIGLGIAHALAARGVKIVLTARRSERLQQAASGLRAQGAEVETLCFDATDPDAWNEAARDCGAVDILCLNAGQGYLGSISESTPEEWRWMIDGNIMSVAYGLQAFLPPMRATGKGGHIVATSSVSGLFAGATGGMYKATKMAVVGMMECLRGELATEDIGVSVYCPHLVRTNIHEHLLTVPWQPDERQAAAIEERVSAGMDPREAGEYVVRGIIDNRLFIFSHPEIEPILRQRYEAMQAALPRVSPDPARVAAEAPTLDYWVYTEAAAQQPPSAPESY